MADTRDLRPIESAKHGEPQAEILDATGALHEVQRPLALGRRADPLLPQQGGGRGAVVLILIG